MLHYDYYYVRIRYLFKIGWFIDDFIKPPLTAASHSRLHCRALYAFHWCFIFLVFFYFAMRLLYLITGIYNFSFIDRDYHFSIYWQKFDAVSFAMLAYQIHYYFILLTYFSFLPFITMILSFILTALQLFITSGHWLIIICCWQLLLLMLSFVILFSSFQYTPRSSSKFPLMPKGWLHAAAAASSVTSHTLYFSGY